jgi:hypothetical protein
VRPIGTTLPLTLYLMYNSSFVCRGADIPTLMTYYVHSALKVTSDGQPQRQSSRRAQVGEFLADDASPINSRTTPH